MKLLHIKENMSEDKVRQAQLLMKGIGKEKKFKVYIRTTENFDK